MCISVLEANCPGFPTLRENAQSWRCQLEGVHTCPALHAPDIITLMREGSWLKIGTSLSQENTENCLSACNSRKGKKITSPQITLSHKHPTSCRILGGLTTRALTQIVRYPVPLKIGHEKHLLYIHKYSLQ